MCPYRTPEGCLNPPIGRRFGVQSAHSGSVVPPGRGSAVAIAPASELAGYCQWSLRDRENCDDSVV